MAINNLESLNTYNLFCESLTTDHFTITGESNNYTNNTFPLGLSINNTVYTTIANEMTPTPWIHNSGELPGFNIIDGLFTVSPTIPGLYLIQLNITNTTSDLSAPSPLVVSTRILQNNPTPKNIAYKVSNLTPDPNYTSVQVSDTLTCYANMGNNTDQIYSFYIQCRLINNVVDSEPISTTELQFNLIITLIYQYSD